MRRRAYSETPSVEKNQKIKGMLQKLTFHPAMPSSRSLPRSFSSPNMFQTTGSYEGKFHPDVIGVIFLDICHAKDLPPNKNRKYFLK